MVGYQHFETLCGAKVDWFIWIFFEYGTVTEATNFIERLGDQWFVLPIAVFDPLDHEDDFLSSEVFVGGYFILSESVLSMKYAGFDG